MRRSHILALSAGLFASTASVDARAQETPDFGTLVSFIRPAGMLVSIVVIAGVIVLLRVVGEVSSRLGKRFAANRLLIQKIESVIRFVTYILAASLCIGLSIRLDSTTLTVIGGALAFAVGFAMRDLVAAFIAGITIMFDRPFQVGDRVEYAGQYGDIIQIGLRSVRMNTLDHNIVTIPNNKVLTDVTSCGNYGALEMQVPMDFHIGIDQDVRRASAIILEACLTSRYIFLDNPVPVLAKQMIVGDLIVIALKARPYVLDTKYEKAFETDVHTRVLEAFREAGIQPPALLYRRIEESPRSTTPRVETRLS